MAQSLIANLGDPILSVKRCLSCRKLLLRSLSLFPAYSISLTCLQESIDALIDCVRKNVGFSQGKPIAAFTIYKCLLNWKSFEAERTSVFDRLIQMIGSAIEVLPLSMIRDILF